MNLKQILPQLIAVAVLILPGLIRAFMSGKNKAKAKSKTPRSARPVPPSVAQRQAAEQWHDRQEALRRKRQAQIDARRAQVRSRTSSRSVSPPTPADLEQRRREVIAELTRRAGRQTQVSAQPRPTAPAQRPSSSAGRPMRPGARQSRPSGRSAPAAQLIHPPDPTRSAPLVAPPTVTSRQTSHDNRERSEQKHDALHRLVGSRTDSGAGRLTIGSIPLTTQSLRQAIILKELLDPPIALR